MVSPNAYRTRGANGQYLPEPSTRSVEERFWSKVDKTEACWLWIGAKSVGYGNFVVWSEASHVKSNVLAHRWAYEQAKGSIPQGLELDHLCRTPACVRPSHLEAVTHQENGRRGLSGINMSSRTACKHGHPFDESNTLWWRGFRLCRACKKRNRLKHNLGRAAMGLT